MENINYAYLSLGSNILPEKNLPDAVHRLARYGKLLAVSSVWETSPVGYLEQANFLNGAVLLETTEPAETFHLRVIAQIEGDLYRIRSDNRNAPRTIDIDLSLFNNQILTLPRHQIPDPEILTRAFVAIPLAEIAPEYIHPETGQTLAQIAEIFRLEKEKMLKRGDVRLW